MMTANESIVVLFAGGGGSSLGIREATGRDPDVAINHDRDAIAMHAANHPGTQHLCNDVWRVLPDHVLQLTGYRRIGLLWASPDCKHFSKAKGGKPVEKKIRDLAWVVHGYAGLPAHLRPRVILLENVEEFRDWGPLVTTEDGRQMPCPVRKGMTFKRWVRELVKLGYRVEHRELRACDYGAPTIRKRLFVIARCDGAPIVWPAATHGKPGAGLPPYRTAAECIDWSIACPSIFTRERPLAEATMRRIARGVMRYVVNAAQPFIVGLAHGTHTERPGARSHGLDEPIRTIHAGGGNHALVTPFIAPITHAGDDRAHSAAEPLRTITTAHRGELALVAPHITKFRGGATGSAADAPMPTVTANSYIKRPGGAAPLGLVGATLIQTGYGERAGQSPRALDLEKPLGTVVAGAAKHAIVSAFLAQHNSGMVGHAATEPVSTIVGKGCTQALVAAHLSHQYTSNTAGGQGNPNLPHKTVTTGGHHALVASFLTKYYGSAIGQDPAAPLHAATAKARFGLVTVMIDGEPWAIADIGMRMLTPRELFRAQGFPDSYEIAPMVGGKPLTKTAQIRACGNSVCPPIAAALVAANAAESAPAVAA